MSIAPPVATAAIDAFDALAPAFDTRFSAWKSVAAQRAAVRVELLKAFSPGASLLELGGGTGEDALFLARRGYRIHVTDGAPTMVRLAREKVAGAALGDRVSVECLAIEELSRLPDDARFDGCYSNFAAFNCVDLDSVPVRTLARALTAGARALFVIFGPCCPGEVVTLMLRGQRSSAFRRFSRGAAPARVGGKSFTVAYPSPGEFARAFAPWFRLRSVRGIGVFVPPSAAEPWISRHPRFLAALERLDRAASWPLALFGDHVLVSLERTEVPA